VRQTTRNRLTQRCPVMFTISNAVSRSTCRLCHKPNGTAGCAWGSGDVATLIHLGARRRKQSMSHTRRKPRTLPIKHKPGWAPKLAWAFWRKLRSVSTTSNRNPDFQTTNSLVTILTELSQHATSSVCGAMLVSLLK
jgi:hypothetical protein